MCVCEGVHTYSLLQIFRLWDNNLLSLENTFIRWSTERTLYHRIRFHHLLYVLFCFEKQKIWKQIELISMFWNKNNINVENCTKFIEHWDSNSWTKRRRKHKRELILLLLYEKTMCSSLLEFTCNWTVWLSASWVCVCVCVRVFRLLLLERIVCLCLLQFISSGWIGVSFFCQSVKLLNFKHCTNCLYHVWHKL